MTNMQINNDIDQTYLDYILAMPGEYYSAIDFNYGLDLSTNLYTQFTMEGGQKQTISLAAANTIYTSMFTKTEYITTGDGEEKTTNSN